MITPIVFIVAGALVAVISLIVLIKIFAPQSDNGLNHYHDMYDGNIIRWTQGGKQHK